MKDTSGTTDKVPIKSTDFKQNMPNELDSLCKSLDWLSYKRLSRKSKEAYITQEVESIINCIVTNKSLGPHGLFH